TNEKTACELNSLLASLLDEDQIFRVDHYLGKNTIRALMRIHENAEDFSLLLSKESVASIRIGLFEEKGIDGRGATYDQVGAFRDVGQNHMLEMLAVLAAELPLGATGAEWQSARAEILKRLEPPAKTCENSRRGQYEGYESEKGVKPDSETETAFEVVTSFRSGKLKGVPLSLEAGKKMGVSTVFIEVLFKEMSGLPKKMMFTVQPEQEILIENRDGSVDAYDVPSSEDAYENVISGAVAGSEAGFVGAEEIKALWSYTDHVVGCWGKVPLEEYGSKKPFLIK
ncbi:MAG TPA: hypothetical protein VFT82_02050, partial [Candidatus Paceibacterota bacterium]|nr:hypothetical protein [Candidatus Paceibacterota bacterium]